MTVMKSLLLGSAATLVVVASAQAADLPTKKGAPAAEYVKVCKVGDIASFIIPGSDTCLCPRPGGPGCVHGPRPPSTTLGLMRRAASLCSTWGVGPPGLGRTCTWTRRTSRRAWTSMPRSSTQGHRRSGSVGRAFAGGTGRTAVVDRQGVVAGATTRRERWRTGGLPAHLSVPGRRVSRPCTRPCAPECAA